MRILVTGGAGFIGSHFVEWALKCRDGRDVPVRTSGPPLRAGGPPWSLRILDKLTYAGNPRNLEALGSCSAEAIAKAPEGEILDCGAFEFVRGDIADREVVSLAIEGCEAVINFAAETHVDRSLLDPGSFILTDGFGTFTLLDAALKTGVSRFLQVSTDEVYGSIEEGAFTEASPLAPSSPYSASKTGGELMALAYWRSHGLPVIVSRASNTFGPRQYPEKLIPLFVTNALEELPLPLYGDGLQVRDWLYVADHCSALALLLERGEPGRAYNIAGGNERANLEITHAILDHLGKGRDLIRHVKDRPGHDRRYALEAEPLRALGWSPATAFEPALRATVEWYAENEAWWRPLKSGEYERFYREWYKDRAE